MGKKNPHHFSNGPSLTEVNLMHESILGVTIAPPPPRDTPGNLPDRQFTGVGNLPFIYVHAGRVLEDPGDLTNGCPESHPQILRQQNLVSGTHVGADCILCPRGQCGVKFIVRISEHYTLCHANLNTTIKRLCFIIFHSSLIL